MVIFEFPAFAIQPLLGLAELQFLKECCLVLMTIRIPMHFYLLLARTTSKSKHDNYAKRTGFAK